MAAYPDRPAAAPTACARPHRAPAACARPHRAPAACARPCGPRPPRLALVRAVPAPPSSGPRPLCLAPVAGAFPGRARAPHRRVGTRRGPRPPPCGHTPRPTPHPPCGHTPRPPPPAVWAFVPLGRDGWAHGTARSGGASAPCALTRTTSAPCIGFGFRRGSLGPARGAVPLCPPVPPQRNSCPQRGWVGVEPRRNSCPQRGWVGVEPRRNSCPQRGWVGVEPRRNSCPQRGWSPGGAGARHGGGRGHCPGGAGARHGGGGGAPAGPLPAAGWGGGGGVCRSGTVARNAGAADAPVGAVPGERAHARGGGWRRARRPCGCRALFLGGQALRRWNVRPRGSSVNAGP